MSWCVYGKSKVRLSGEYLIQHSKEVIQLVCATGSAVWLWLFFFGFGVNEYMKLPIYFLSQKENNPPALSQHIHCYCCSALRNACNKISLFSFWQLPAVVKLYSLSVRICLKIFSLGLVGGSNYLLLKVNIILYGSSVHAFHMLRVFHFWGREDALIPQVLGYACPPVRAPECTWSVALVLCFTCALQGL